MSTNPKVSVCVVTYNHEKYIRQCLESIVTQECDFDFEVIVGEDCSTDGTKVIVEEYAKKYPNIVKPIYHKENVGGDKNYLSVHKATQGELICHIDGDDYTLPGKLQNQADFMDNTPDCNICFHRVYGLYPDGQRKKDLVDYEKIKDGFIRDDILMYMAVATHSSKMYRKEVKDFPLPPNFIISDFYMNVMQIGNKKAYFINNSIYGIYRIGVGDSTNSKLKIKNLIIDTLDYFLVIYPDSKSQINSNYLILFAINLKKLKNFKDYFRAWLKSFTFYGLYLSFKTWKTRRMFRIEKQG